MNKDKIIIKGARENNLKNINVEIPKEKFTIITGVSGSGKSSLAFEVLYNEGRRRYVDSLSNYARQFIGGTNKPDVDSIEGLSPAIAIDQKTTSNNPRSTVGTITEIYDFYRLLFARVGKPYCPNHNIEISKKSISEILDSVYSKYTNKTIMVLSPVVSEVEEDPTELLDKLRSQSFIRVKINNKIFRLDQNIKLPKAKKTNISIIIDRVEVNEENRGRLFEGFQLSSEHSKGFIEIEYKGENERFSSNYSCPYGDFTVDKIEPRLFSFNSPQGACPKCSGLGINQEVTWEKLIDRNLTILEGGIKYFGEKMQGIDWTIFKALLEHYDIPITKKLSSFTKRDKELIINGSDEPIHYAYKLKGNSLKEFKRIEGLGEKIWRRYEATSSERSKDFYKKFLGETVCNLCNGNRINEKASSVKIEGINITELTKLSIGDSLKWINKIKLNKKDKEISKLIVDEIKSRLFFLENVGLNYLTLNRIAGTLSGGESQRIRLASQLGTKLTGVIYVLDEPSIGLHQRDNTKLIQTLKDIRDLGNTVVVVEHDEETMYEADYIIDIGLDAGENGGEVIAFGTPDQVSKMDTHTGNFLSGKEYIPVPKKRREGNGKYLEILGSKENNLKNANAAIPLGTLTVVSGVSGSGKSTIINEILYKELYNRLTKNAEPLRVGEHDSIKGSQYLDKVVAISQDPIGRTPRSNPATYTGVFDEIRTLFSQTKEAKIRGYEKGRFSFNVPGGRCDKCEGDGIIRIPMHFLPDVHVVCDLCEGKRYNEETLQIKYKNKTISDVLKMSVDEALKFFSQVHKIYNKLLFLKDVGLGYIKLGHSATLLSGGEAQRVKLAYHLQKKATGKTLYILDEPTTGLHNADIKILLKVLQRIVDGGDTLIVIEHNLDIIKSADWIIDLGPEGGEGGGRVVAKGTPENIIGNKESATAPYLKEALNRLK